MFKKDKQYENKAAVTQGLHEQHLLAESLKGHRKQPEKHTDLRDPIKTFKGGESAHFSFLPCNREESPGIHGKSSGRSCVAVARAKLPNTRRAARSKEEKLFYTPAERSKTRALTVKCFSTRNNTQKFRITYFVLVKDKDPLHFFFLIPKFYRIKI